MDIEELDEWLGPDEDGHDRAGVGGATTAPPEPGAWERPGHRRADLVGAEGRQGGPRRWVVIGGAAVLLWLTVMLLLLGGSDEAPPTADEDLAVLDAQAGTVAATAPPAPPPPDDAPADTPGADGGGGDGPDGADVIESDTAAASAEITAVGGGLAASGAIVALRQALLDTPDDLDRYLEWAVPVQRTPLAEEVDLVVLDAVWLQGPDGAYDTAQRGYWAVPVTLDGAVLAAPWAVDGVAPRPPPDPAVPLLRQRTDEVEEALGIAGWSRVVVQASEAHPDLRGTWLALVDGVDPAGVPRAGAVVWLDDEDPLSVLGLHVLALSGLDVTGAGPGGES